MNTDSDLSRSGIELRSVMHISNCSLETVPFPTPVGSLASLSPLIEIEIVREYNRDGQACRRRADRNISTG